MNVIFGDTPIPSAVSRSYETAHITGNVPLPRAAKRVILTDGHTDVVSSEAATGVVNVSGKLTLNAICENESGGLFSFTATADFSHRLNCSEAEAGMHASVTTQLISIDSAISGDSLELNANVDIMCRIEDGTAKKMLKDGQDIELYTETVCCKSRESVGNISTRMREDIVANDISSVVYADASAFIRDITCVIDTARVDGILNLNALCYDKEGGFIRLRQNIPFTADVQTKYDNCTGLLGNVNVSDIRLRVTEDEYGLATVDAQLDIELFSLSDEYYTLTLDAFSPVEPFSCTKRGIQLLLYKETAEQKAVCKETVKLKAPSDFQTEVFCTARPLVSSAMHGDGCIIVDGIMAVNVLYLNSSNELNLASDSLPFSVKIPTEYDNTEIDAHPLCTAVTTGITNESGIEVSVSMHIVADIYALRDIDIVSGVEKCECPCTQNGFVICFASDGDTPYEIAKRFNISQKELASANPNLGSKLNEGDVAVLLR